MWKKWSVYVYWLFRFGRECNCSLLYKRSLGKGNIFIGVCQEFCSQGGGSASHPPGPGTPLRADTPQDQAPPLGAEHAGRYGQRAGGTHPTGMQSCLINKFKLSTLIMEYNSFLSAILMRTLLDNLGFHFWEFINLTNSMNSMKRYQKGRRLDW